MQYIAAAALALAAIAQAAPHFPPHGGYGGGPPAAPVPGTGIGFPTATGGVAHPTGFPSYPTGYRSRANVRDDGDDEDDDEDGDEEEETSDEEESSSSSSSSNVSTSSASSPQASSSSNATAPAVTATPSASSGGSSTSKGKLPASKGSTALDAVKTIAAGESFDGGLVAFDRGVSCTGQTEGGDSDAVFYLEEGASLSNVIIGPNQIEGVHCFGACKLTNVWWAAVCEDAFTIKEQEAGATTTISGGGAFGAEDKVLQHNGGGTMSVSGFTVETFGKLYRSCGNCKTMYERHVIFSDITATNGKSLAGINSNYGDTATFKSVTASGVSDICVEYEGNDTGDEPEKISSGPSDACIYSTSDVTSS